MRSVTSRRDPTTSLQYSGLNVRGSAIRGTRWTARVVVYSMLVTLSGFPTSSNASSRVFVPNTSTQDSEPGYYGFWDVRGGRADTYATEVISVTLGDLVRTANAAKPTKPGMAQVIRNGRAGIRLPWSADGNEPLLPGDLVIYYDNAASARGPQDDQTVPVAFVGLVERCPRVVRLPGHSATVAFVLASLQQPAEAAKGLRVIRTNPHAPPIPFGTLPDRLAAGDVLVFDRTQLNAQGLASSQALAATRFDPPTPMLAQRAQDPVKGNHIVEESVEVTVASTVSERSQAPAVGQLDLGPTLPHASESRQDGSQTSTAMWDLAAERKIVPTVDPEIERASAKAVPAVRPSSGTGANGGGPTLAMLVESDPRDFDSPGLSSFDQIENAVPVARTTSEAVKSLTGPTDQKASPPSTWGGLLTLAFGVMGFAALCFAASYVWIRIMRTAQALQQPLPVRTDDPPSRRRLLDRMIDNRLPMTEEQAPLPNRMDYHGKELGRKRLMLDPPHALAGPHFKMEASASREADSGESNHVPRPRMKGNSQAEYRLDRVVQQGRQKPQSKGEAHDELVSLAETVHQEIRMPGPQQPHGGLLERVLIAMEREKRR